MLAEPIDVGEGVPPPTTRFRFTVFRHNFGSVKPQSVEIAVKDDETLSDSRTLEFEPASPVEDRKTPSRLDALIEISQKGQTVGVLTIGGDEER